MFSVYSFSVKKVKRDKIEIYRVYFNLEDPVKKHPIIPNLFNPF